LKKAQYWIEKAAKQGNEGAKHDLPIIIAMQNPAKPQQDAQQAKPQESKAPTAEDYMMQLLRGAIQNQWGPPQGHPCAPGGYASVDPTLRRQMCGG